MVASRCVRRGVPCQVRSKIALMEKQTPTVPPPRPDDLSSALRRNIEALEARRKQEFAAATVEARVAEAITRFTGSMRFVYVHLALYGAWIAVNLGMAGDGGVGRGDLSVHLRAD